MKQRLPSHEELQAKAVERCVEARFRADYSSSASIFEDDDIDDWLNPELLDDTVSPVVVGGSDGDDNDENTTN